MQGIKITTDNIISVVDIDTSDYHAIVDCIDCDIFEVVGTELLNSYFNEKVVIVMDEEALVKNLPVNQFGSFFYGSIVHGHPICGDIILFIRDFSELEGFDSPNVIVQCLLDDFPFLELA